MREETAKVLKRIFFICKMNILSKMREETTEVLKRIFFVCKRKREDGVQIPPIAKISSGAA